MHQIHRGVGLQKVAPDAFAGVGFARHQQHAQAVTHAVDLHDGGIVAVGQLAVNRGDRELQHVLPAMGQGDGQFQIGVNGDREGHGFVCVNGDGDLGFGAKGGGRALVFDAQFQNELFANDGKGRGVGDNKAAVPIGFAPGQQNVQGRGQVGGKAGVMHLPVGDDDRACDAGTRFGGDGLRQGGQGQRSGILGPIGKAGDAQFGVLKRGHRAGQFGQRGVGLGFAVGQGLAGAVIDHGQNDIGQGFAGFFLQGRVQQRRAQCRHRQRPQGPAAQATPKRQRQQQQRQPGQPVDQRQGHQGVKDHHAAHSPNLSKSAGTWT